MDRRALTIVVLLAVLIVGLPRSIASGSPQQCDGHDVTIFGTSGNDVLNGTNRADVIYGGAGNDVINGRGGIDRICGGPGRDFLTGPGSQMGPGDHWERLLGGRGRDAAFFAGATHGVVAYLSRRGFKRGGVFKSEELGGGRLIGLENLRGTRYDDSLYGESGANKLLGRDGDDTLEGRDGNDRLNGSSGSDTADGGGGQDRCLHVEHRSHCES